MVDSLKSVLQKVREEFPQVGEVEAMARIRCQFGGPRKIQYWVTAAELAPAKRDEDVYSIKGYAMKDPDATRFLNYWHARAFYFRLKQELSWSEE